MKSAVIRVGILLAAVFGLVSVAAANACRPYIDEVVETVDFEKIENLLSKIPEKKGEFETTAELQNKFEKIVSALPESYLIGYDLHGELNYDVENQQLLVSSYALVGSADYYDSLGYGAPSQTSIYNQKVNAVDVVVSKKSWLTRKYRASNTLGASTTVKEYRQETRVLFEKQHDASTFRWLSPIPMSVDDAKRVKKHATAAVLAVPKSPYFEKDYGFISPTLSRPNDIKETYFVIHADIQCVFLLDDKSKVFGAFAVN